MDLLYGLRKVYDYPMIEFDDIADDLLNDPEFRASFDELYDPWATPMQNFMEVLDSLPNPW